MNLVIQLIKAHIFKGNVTKGVLLTLLLPLGACGADSRSQSSGGKEAVSSSHAPAEKGGPSMAFMMKSEVFEPGGMIPSRFTCDGEDISPPLSWEDAPEQTHAFALIMDDPDAPVGTWIHWIVFNLPPQARSLPESVGKGAQLPAGTQRGKNSWERLRYGGPCPPGGIHRYFFKLYALDSRLDLNEGIRKEELVEAMKGHVLGQAELMGRYRRKGGQ